MSEYRKVIVRNRDRYMYRVLPTNRWLMIAEAAIPAHIRPKLVHLAPGLIYSDEPIAKAPAQSDRVCIFCASPGTCQKYVNAQMVYLCSDDYENKTTGEVSQRVREFSDAKEESQEA